MKSQFYIYNYLSCFFHAIIVLKRFVRKCRGRWVITSNNKFHKYQGKTPLHLEILRSNKAVQQASFGRRVITLDEAAQHIVEQEQRRKKQKEERKHAESSVESNSIKFDIGEFSRSTVSHYQVKRQLDGQSFTTLIHKINSLQSSYSPSKDCTNSKSKKIKDNGTIVDLSGIVAKNARMMKMDQELSGPAKGKDMKNNMKNMKKLDLQEVLDYVAGTAIYFGATIAIQAIHGGFLTYSASKNIKASAKKILPSARFVVRNCDDLGDVGVLRYGDAVWLQAGPHEVLGAQYGGEPIKSDLPRQIHPAVINCRRANFFKAQQYGRWIVLKKDSPTKCLGEQVLHLDTIFLEQEWYFLASNASTDSYMQKSNFENADRGKDNLYKPSEECHWQLHLVALPSDDKVEERYRQFLLQQSKQQLKESQKGRWEKSKVFDECKSRNLASHLDPFVVVSDKLAHKRSDEHAQKRLLELFLSTGDKNVDHFHDPNFLKVVYGTRSSIYNIAQTILQIKASNLNALGKKEKSKAKFTEEALIEAEEQYWEAARRLLVDSECYESLQSSMKKYYKIDNARKDAAAFIIQRFFRKVLRVSFNWKRTFQALEQREVIRQELKKLARHEVIMLQKLQVVESIVGNNSSAHNNNKSSGAKGDGNTRLGKLTESIKHSSSRMGNILALRDKALKTTTINFKDILNETEPLSPVVRKSSAIQMVRQPSISMAVRSDQEDASAPQLTISRGVERPSTANLFTLPASVLGTNSKLLRHPSMRGSITLLPMTSPGTATTPGAPTAGIVPPQLTAALAFYKTTSSAFSFDSASSTDSDSPQDSDSDIDSSDHPSEEASTTEAPQCSGKDATFITNQLSGAEAAESSQPCGKKSSMRPSQSSVTFRDQVDSGYQNEMEGNDTSYKSSGVGSIKSGMLASDMDVDVEDTNHIALSKLILQKSSIVEVATSSRSEYDPPHQLQQGGAVDAAIATSSSLAIDTTEPGGRASSEPDLSGSGSVSEVEDQPWRSPPLTMMMLTYDNEKINSSSTFLMRNPHHKKSSIGIGGLFRSPSPFPNAHPTSPGQKELYISPNSKTERKVLLKHTDSKVNWADTATGDHLLPSPSRSPLKTNKDATPNQYQLINLQRQFHVHQQEKSSKEEEVVNLMERYKKKKTLKAAQAEEEKKLSSDLKTKLGMTVDMAYGLPDDTFEEIYAKPGLSSSIKFLKATSKDPHFYDEIVVARRENSAFYNNSRDKRSSNHNQSLKVFSDLKGHSDYSDESKSRLVRNRSLGMSTSRLPDRASTANAATSKNRRFAM